MPVDAWTLRCLYNRSDYAVKIAVGVLVALHREVFARRSDGSCTVQVYYGTASPRSLRVRLQWFESAAGEILRSGQKDPKEMYLERDAADYHMHPGDRCWQKVRREPELVLPWIPLRKAYGWWRTFKCRTLGPIEARRMLWWRASHARAWLVRSWSATLFVARTPRRLRRQYRVWRRSKRGAGPH